MGQRSSALGRVTTESTKPALVILAAGRARRYGGCKPLAPVGPRGEAVIDLVASDALAAGFGSIVLVLGPATGPAIRYHVTRTWPSHVDVRFALQEAPLGTVHAVLSASDHVGDAPYGVGNADDIYGRAASSLLAAHLTSPDADECPGRVPPGGRRGRPCAGHARCLPGRARGPAAPSGRKAPGHGTAPTVDSPWRTGRSPRRCRPMRGCR